VVQKEEGALIICAMEVRILQLDKRSNYAVLAAISNESSSAHPQTKCINHGLVDNY
jgi:hypothetical protein